MTQKSCAFFMGANSRNGFVSLFDTLRQEDPQRRIYTVKSGPGCGKSTCIRRIADALHPAGTLREDLYCSSDPNSLDGVLLDGAQLAVLDGTAPHITDPAFPGADGDYLTFPPFLDLPALQEKYPALLALSAASKQHYRQAYRLICASAAVDDTVREEILPHAAVSRIRRRAEGIISRELPRRGNDREGVLRQRFLDGITPKGSLCLYDTANVMAQRIYDLQDSYGLGRLMLEPIRDAALQRGLTVYACLCPKSPQRLRHLILPQLQLAFVTSDTCHTFDGVPYRRIHLDTYIDTAALRRLRGKLRLLQRVSRSLTEDAVAEIAAAHKLHDEMESLYRPHIDFAALDKSVTETIATLAQ